MTNIRQIVNDPTWQRLRRSLKGTWKHTPVKNIKRLRAYLFAEHPVRSRKLRQVHNYLTGSGFRLGIINHPAIDKLLKEVRALKP